MNMEEKEFNLEDLHVEKELKIVYMGTPEFSATVLKGLLEKYKVRAVITQPDRVNGRGGKVTYSPVKQVALEHTLLILQPEKIRDITEQILELEPDLIITCAYGQILPKGLLLAPRLGCINVHASLLPKLRGGAPIHRAIMNGYKKTGITIMYMNEKMDEGDMISQKEIEITETDTAETLHDKLSVLGRDLLLETLPSILDGTNPRIPQNHEEATYGYVIDRKDEHINFNHSKKQIYDQVRGLNSFPGAYCKLDGDIIKVWECYKTDQMYPQMFNGQVTKIYKDGIGVKVDNGEIVLKTIQPSGKKRMNGADFARGYENKGTLISKMFS